MASLKKLVIVRTCVADRAKAAASVKIVESLMKDFATHLDASVTMPIAIIPIAWSVEEKASHVGFVLTGLKLKSLMALKEWEEAVKIATVRDLGDTPDAIDVALYGVGLRVHPLAD